METKFFLKKLQITEGAERDILINERDKKNQFG